MKYLYWFVLAIVQFFFTNFIARPLAPIIALFANDEGWLPMWLCWFQTFDASLDAGTQIGLFRTQNRYVNRVRYLWRNSAYGFAYWFLGKQWIREWNTPKVYIVTEQQTLIIHDWPGGFGLYYHGPYGMYKLGWKAFQMMNRTESWGPMWIVPLTMSMNPFKRKGK